MRDLHPRRKVENHVRFTGHRSQAGVTARQRQAGRGRDLRSELASLRHLGCLWLLIGFFALSYRPSSVSVAVVFIAIAFWMGALSAFVVASVVSGADALAITFGILASLAAVGALVWPEPTRLIVAIFVAWYLLFSGIFEVAVALSNSDVHGWWIKLLGGIASIGLGAWAIGNPERSVLSSSRSSASSPSSAAPLTPPASSSVRCVTKWSVPDRNLGATEIGSTPC